jgi:hypothetical protein
MGLESTGVRVLGRLPVTRHLFDVRPDVLSYPAEENPRRHMSAVVSRVGRMPLLGVPRRYDMNLNKGRYFRQLVYLPRSEFIVDA